jgi:hypothetical protein
MYTKFSSYNLKERETYEIWEDILRKISGNCDVKYGQNSSDLVKDLVAGSHECRKKAFP